MERFKSKLSAWEANLCSRKTALTKAIHKLESTGCQDEANLDKVRLNIVTLFETLAHADATQSNNIWEAFFDHYKARFATVPQPWLNRLEQARLHNNAAAQIIEEVKLETARALENDFVAMKE